MLSNKTINVISAHIGKDVLNSVIASDEYAEFMQTSISNAVLKKFNGKLENSILSAISLAIFDNTLHFFKREK
jgi:hypothetical protein